MPLRARHRHTSSACIVTNPPTHSTRGHRTRVTTTRAGDDISPARRAPVLAGVTTAVASKSLPREITGRLGSCGNPPQITFAL
jgi:hypothetical protein